ncbi:MULTISPECIES: flagellar assembly protein FliH [unclassified Psychrobacillus]|uniref:flagellar assembly protein FliH n=1 Tax=unclassified Psychrobacillus TaxID=2636677 RepID=UPI0012AF636C|nr:flagellar assembly protein FliH [Bacillus sp. N3536]
MTLLSRIFRNVQMNENSEKIRPIHIKNLYVEEDTTEESVVHENFSADRNRMLEEVNQEIAKKQQELQQELEHSRNIIQNELNEWNEQKLSYQKSAYDEGFAQGLEEGRLKAMADMQNKLAVANEAMQTAYTNAAAYLQQQEQVILELSIRNAERILGVKLEDEHELFLSIVRRGLKEAREMKEIKIYVSPVYFSLVSENREELASIFPVDVPFMIFVDEEMNDTDCYIETNHGRIVVSIDEQVKELRRKLVDILESME